MRKISVITGARADYSILYPVLQAIKKHSRLRLLLITAGMHLSHEFGYTIKEIKRDGFKINAKVDMLLSDDTGARMARSIGVGVLDFAQAFEILKPDMVMVLGDREEAFAAAVAGTCLNIPVAHIGGGDIATGGHIDESIRHSITKFSHIHFPTTKKSAERIINLGEEKWSVFQVGLPSIDRILNEKLIPSKILARKFSLDLSKPIILVLQHPLAIQPKKSAKQIRKTMEAISELKSQTFLIYPNADAGGGKMIQVIKKYEKHSFIRTFKNIPSIDYLSLMRIASVIVGNSSSGILEAPSFHLPAVNIGARQSGRERAVNVIDVDYDKEQIKKAIEKAIYNKKFREKVKKCKSPYGDGHASERIVKVLESNNINIKLIHKKISY